MKKARDFRECARNALRGRWAIAVITTLIASLLGGRLFDVEYSLQLGSYGEIENSGTVDTSALFDEFITYALLALPYILITLFIAIAVGSIVKIGHARFYLNVVDGYHASVGVLFSYFRRWSTALAATLLTYLFTFIGFCLFIIPGFIVMYSLSMTPFIIAEDDGITAVEALKKSNAMMRGNRFRLFSLHISFLGWMLLSVLSLGVGFLWLNPYVNASLTDFYRDVSGTYRIPHLIVDEPVEGDFDSTSSSDSNDNDWYYGNN